MVTSDWSSDVCSSDLRGDPAFNREAGTGCPAGKQGARDLRPVFHDRTVRRRVFGIDPRRDFQSDLTVMQKNGATYRPRVLFVSHETTLSGAPIQLVHLAGWLQERGWNILVATPDYGPISDMLAARGVPTVVETTLLTDLTHAWLREQCQRFDVIVANTIASWPRRSEERRVGKEC